ncbi:hypothetical protein RRG08_004977 [Elysia crispata]|uniref:Uncharacterized protein n=1 Tax=Elysia crispata TaxID=231223 RepID=A0AAE0Z2U7_9GAST|nr:hypothetical protein RRG08_004977 [Elysia crispata]
MLKPSTNNPFFPTVYGESEGGR